MPGRRPLPCRPFRRRSLAREPLEVRCELAEARLGGLALTRRQRLVQIDQHREILHPLRTRYRSVLGFTPALPLDRPVDQALLRLPCADNGEEAGLQAIALLVAHAFRKRRAPRVPLDPPQFALPPFPAAFLDA